jgi:hypothetical protein
MRRTWITTGIMLVIAAALGAFIFFKPPARESSLQALSALRPNDAVKLRIARSGKPVMELERKGLYWMLTAPYAAPVDLFQVARALSVLDAKSTVNYPANELRKFDLDPPSVQVTINDKSFAFGAINPVTREQYVLTNNSVHAIEMRHGAGLPADAAALLRKELFGADEIPVKFMFAEFSIASNSGKWLLIPAAGELSQDDYARWVDAWRQASALRAEPYDKRRPIGEARVELKDGKILSLGILSREPELVLLRVDINLQFAFAGEVGKRMLMPPRTSK